MNLVKSILIVFLAGLSCQRFLMPQFYALSPLIALVFYWFIKLKGEKSDITLLILALLMCVDNGGDVYSETPVALRYLIYIWIIAKLIPRNNLNIKGALLLLCLYFYMTFQMLFNIDTIRISTVAENVIQLALLSIFLLGKNFKIYEKINIKQVLIFIVAYVIFDLMNYIMLYEPAIGYMNYNSTKAILVLPFLYLIANKNVIVSFLYLGPLTFVLIANGTRFIPVMFVATMVLLFLKTIIKSKNEIKIMLIILIYSVVKILSEETNSNGFEASKVTNFFYQIITNFSFDLLRVLEPVRMDENELFFSRSVYEILFGSGLGSGLWDKDNLFSYIKYEQYAFTKLEIDSGIFHGLHDFWTDIGLRFGLIFVFIIIAITVKNIFIYDKEASAYWATALIILMCSFYSTAGLLLILIVYGLAMNSNTALESYGGGTK